VVIGHGTAPVPCLIYLVEEGWEGLHLIYPIVVVAEEDSILTEALRHFHVRPCGIMGWNHLLLFVTDVGGVVAVGQEEEAACRELEVIHRFEMRDLRHVVLTHIQ